MGRAWSGIILSQFWDQWWAIVSKVINLHVPWNAGNFLGSKRIIVSRRTQLHGVTGSDYSVE
jgi:hypothetical protein